MIFCSFVLKQKNQKLQSAVADKTGSFCLILFIIFKGIGEPPLSFCWKLIVGLEQFYFWKMAFLVGGGGYGGCGGCGGWACRNQLVETSLSKSLLQKPIFLLLFLLFVLKQKVTKSSRLDRFAKKWWFLLRKSPNLRGLEIVHLWWILAALQTLGIFNWCLVKYCDGRNNPFSWRKMLLGRREFLFNICYSFWF